MQVCTIAKLSDLLQYLAQERDGAEVHGHHERVLAYRQRYGVQEG